MVMKKVIAGTLAAIMCLSATAVLPTSQVVYAETNSTTVSSCVGNFHYDQLDATAKAIYDGIYQMYEQGLLKTGTQDYDLVANGQISADAAQGFMKNTSALTTAMNAARYAFYADYPEVFYVNFPKLNVRPTKDSDGGCHIYVGSGRYENYYLDGFTSEAQVDAAIAEFDARVNAIVDGARNLEIPENKNQQVEQIRYVHNEIINHVSYRLEDTCFEGDGDSESNASYLGTPYGTLVKKQSVCEGYARAFKTVMDKMGIHSILVQGVHQYDGEVAVSHMWNYVEIDATDEAGRSLGGKWYAMDLTQDDPEDYIIPEKELVDYTQHFEEYGKDGFENEKYFLAGQLTLNGRHFIDETIDAAGGYTFTYPSIEDVDYGVRDAINTMDGFSVKQKTVTGGHGLDVTEFQISYKGMNVTTARKEGIYILARYYDEDEEGNVVPLTGWCYFSDSYEFKEDDTSVYLQEGEVQYMEFAATTVVPREGLDGLTYAGDDLGLIARTGKIYNENQNDYDAPPFILRATPSQTATIFPGASTYHIMLEYDETLVLEEGVSENDLSMMIKCSSNLGNEVTGAEYSKVSNITWDGDKIVEFDVQFSQMFADDHVNYNFYPQGLIGSESKKAPNPACYGVAQRTECPCVQDRRGSWELYAKPTLLEDTDLSVQDWTLSNGKAVSDKLTNRIALVTTKTSAKQESQMQQALDRDLPGESEQILESSTFNITLSVCKLNVVKTGHKLKVKVGFPTGYGPEDEGVTFKAYHFKRDAQGNVTGVEEIDCVVTPYGLIITCDAFSPFTIAAVKADDTAAQTKSVVATTSDGGIITGANLAESKLLTLSEGGNETLHIQPNDMYEIESITVCGNEIDVTDKNGMDVTVSYDAIGTNNIVHANFVAKAVVEKEAERNEAPVAPTAEPVTITMPKEFKADKELRLTPEISEAVGMLTYQWYKDGQKLDGQTNAELYIESPTEADNGKYQLQVIHTVDTVSAETMSEECAVTYVGDCPHTNIRMSPAIESTCVIPGHTEFSFCQDCGLVVSGEDKELPLGPHNMIEDPHLDYLKSEATCASKAVYYKHCSECEAVSEETFEAGEVLEHSNTEVRNAKTESCVEDGYTGDLYCKDCNTKISEGTVIPAIGHALDKIFPKDASHGSDGNIEHYKCSVCGKLYADAEATKEVTEADVIIDGGTHTYSKIFKFNDTEHWKDCECGETIERGAHTFGDWTVTKEATNEEAGSKERTCAVCLYKEVVEIPIIGSDNKPGTDDKNDPTTPGTDDKQDPSKPNTPGTGNGNNNNTNTGTGNQGDGTNGGTTTRVAGPKTGDQNSLLVWSVLAMLSGAALSIGVIRSKRRKGN